MVKALLGVYHLATVLARVFPTEITPAAECHQDDKLPCEPRPALEALTAGVVNPQYQSTSAAHIWYSTICVARTVPRCADHMNHDTYFLGNRDRTPFGLWNHIAHKQGQSGSKNSFHNRTFQNATLHQNSENGQKTLRVLAVDCIQIVYNLRKNRLVWWEKLWLSFPRFMRILWIGTPSLRLIPTYPYSSTHYPTASPHRFPQPFRQCILLLTHRFSPFSTAPTNTTAIYI